MFGRCGVTRDEAEKKAQIIDLQGGYTIELVSQIFDEHEALLKAKDDDFRELQEKAIKIDVKRIKLEEKLNEIEDD